MKRKDKCFVLSIVAGDMGENRRKRYGDIRLRKNERQLSPDVNAGELKMPPLIRIAVIVAPLAGPCFSLDHSSRSFPD
jgi:hypothetical protein